MPKNEKPNKNDAALDAALADIRKQYGDGAVMKLSDTAALDIEAVSTGSMVLDKALGIGGLPRGRIIEAFGPESSGKTTLALHVIASAQKSGDICAFVDAEHALDPVYAKAIGVDCDNLLISQPDTGEEALEIVERLTRSGAVGVIVVDSVAALVPRAEINGEMGDSHIGLQARLMSQAMRKLAGTVANTGTTLLFINQIREKVGVMFGSPEVTPGGRALRFYSSVRIDIRRKTQIKQDNDVIGNETHVKVVKNKVAPPFKECDFNILYGIGIDNAATIRDIAVEMGHIKKSGAWYSYDGEQIAQGAVAAASWLRARPEILEKLQVKILSGEMPLTS